jgi:hypothetical protein
MFAPASRVDFLMKIRWRSTSHSPTFLMRYFKLATYSRNRCQPMPAGRATSTPPSGTTTTRSRSSGHPSLPSSSAWRATTTSRSECAATEPAGPEDDPVEMAGLYRAQVEDFEAAARRNGVRLRLMDVTGMMLRRPDGHPDRYGHGPGRHDGFDCLHWCLPGPIDVWNDLLFRIIAKS